MDHVHNVGKFRKKETSKTLDKSSAPLREALRINDNGIEEL